MPPVELPIYQIGNREYYRDERLNEYRATDNPSVRITFDEFDREGMELRGVDIRAAYPHPSRHEQVVKMLEDDGFCVSSIHQKGSRFVAKFYEPDPKEGCPPPPTEDPAATIEDLEELKADFERRL